MQHQIIILLRAGNLSGARLYQCTVWAACRNNHGDAVKRPFSKLALDNLRPYLHADYEVVRELQRLELVPRGTYGVYS